MKIVEVPGRGRGATAAKDFKAGDFICEYAVCVKPKKASLKPLFISGAGLL